MHFKALKIECHDLVICGSLVFFGGLGFTICWFHFLLFRLQACRIACKYIRSKQIGGWQMCWFHKSRFDARAAFSRNGRLLGITCRIDHDRSPEKLWLNSLNFLFDVFSACLISWFNWFYSEFDRDPECWRETCSSCSQLSPDPITSRRQDLWTSCAIHMEAGIHVSMMPDVTKSQDVIDWCLPQESLCMFIA